MDFTYVPVQLHRQPLTNTSKNTSQPTKNIQSYLKKHMLKNYSTSQSQSNYLNIEKNGNIDSIQLNDLNFCDDNQHIEKYYPATQSCQQLPQLFQYYKYYTQESLCFLNRQFQFLAVHHEKKKAALYIQLKKQLNISDSDQTLSEVTKIKEQQGAMSNVLNGLSTSRINWDKDQSYCFAQTVKKLNNYFGVSQKRPLKSIDSEFKFMTHSLPINKAKQLQLDQIFNQKKNQNKNCHTPSHNKCLQSTNTSLRNTNNNQQHRNKKNATSHKRFISCQFVNSVNNGGSTIMTANITRDIGGCTALNNTKINIKTSEDMKNSTLQKKSKNRRRKSADQINISKNSQMISSSNGYANSNTNMRTNTHTNTHTSTNTNNGKTVGKSGMLRKNKHMSPLLMSSTQQISTSQTTLDLHKQKQKQIKKTIQFLRSKIRREKQNFSGHLQQQPASNCTQASMNSKQQLFLKKKKSKK